ncbi:hypothetical protein KM908_22480, partial [Alkalihalobacillus clausii]|uniref:hypothetical protein n=1 Tax=Shouchella clausii TaxID=79880 RepID=UPI001C23B946
VEFGDTAATLHGKVGVSGSSPLGSFSQTLTHQAFQPYEGFLFLSKKCSWGQNGDEILNLCVASRSILRVSHCFLLPFSSSFLNP